MIDLSESGLLGILTNLVLVFLLFFSIVDGYHYFKKRTHLLSFILFSVLTVLTAAVAILTSLYALDTYALIISAIFLASLFLSLRFKKSVSIFWVALILVIISFTLSFFSYLISGEIGTKLASVHVDSVVKKPEPLIQGYITYKDEKRDFTIKGEMLGMEAFQTVLKPFMQFLFGKKRLLLTSLFGEVFEDNFNRGTVFYYPLEVSLFDKRQLWQSLERKKLLIVGVDSVQRVGVSIYPKERTNYELKMTHQGLVLVSTD